MENRENPVFGRKVFFLNPGLKVHNSIVGKLRQKEFEVYEIEDYKDAKPVLSENEDAICFIDIDSGLSFKEWFNFVKSFEFDYSLQGIFIGILSAKATPLIREQFMLKAKLPGGMVNMNENTIMLLDTIERILEINGAKGRRKYVRLDCYGLENVYASCMVSGRMIDFTLEDLSSVGFAAICSKTFLPLLKKDMMCGLTLRIGSKDIFIECKIFAVKESSSTVTCVFMFRENTDEKIRIDIRNFVFAVLQKKMNALINSSIKDLTDYSKEIEIPKDTNAANVFVDDVKFDAVDDSEVLPVLGDLEEL